MRSALSTLLVATTALALTAGCSSEPQKPLAEKAEKLEPEKPKSIEARTFKIQGPGSSVGFEMEAPLEKIRGRVPEGAISGEINVDFMDLTKSNGLVHVDIKELELFQRKAGDDGTLGEETKSDLQNEHARAWLEIGEDAPEEDRVKNTRVEYSVKTVKSASVTDLTKVSGAERKVTLQVEGELLLHQRKATKAAELEVVFTFDGETPTKMTVKTVKPLGIGLEEYDVRPREAFGKLAAKTLGALSDKVAQQAELSVEFAAIPDPNQAPAPAATPAADAAKDEKKEAAPAY